MSLLPDLEAELVVAAGRPGRHSYLTARHLITTCVATLAMLLIAAPPSHASLETPAPVRLAAHA